jgi:hypothetical protein
MDNNTTPEKELINEEISSKNPKSKLRGYFEGLCIITALMAVLCFVSALAGNIIKAGWYVLFTGLIIGYILLFCRWLLDSNLNQWIKVILGLITLAALGFCAVMIFFFVIIGFFESILG